MKTLSEYFPLLLILFFFIVSVRKGMNRKKQKEDMANSQLPDCKSEEMATAEKSVPAKPIRESQSRISKPSEQSKSPLTGLSSPDSKSNDTEEEPSEAVFDLDIDDTDEIKKAVVYTEILNRKAH